MLILECSQGCYGRTDGSVTISLRNFVGEGITSSVQIFFNSVNTLISLYLTCDCSSMIHTYKIFIQLYLGKYCVQKKTSSAHCNEFEYICTCNETTEMKYLFS